MAFATGACYDRASTIQAPTRVRPWVVLVVSSVRTVKRYR